MNAREFFKETTLLALAMTGPPILLLILVKLTLDLEPLPLLLWATFAVAWTILISFLYYRKRIVSAKRQLT